MKAVNQPVGSSGLHSPPAPPSSPLHGRLLRVELRSKPPAKMFNFRLVSKSDAAEYRVDRFHHKVPVTFHTESCEVPTGGSRTTTSKEK